MPRDACAPETDVLVPGVLALRYDPTVIGSQFYVMDFFPGRIFGDPTLPGLKRSGCADI